MALSLPGSPYVESSDLVANYPAVSESLAERVDLVGVLPFADSAARTTALPTPTDGQFSYLQDTNTAEYYDGSVWAALGGGGAILQVVRATDTTSRTTTSTSFTDVTGMAVTITPQVATSKVLVIATGCTAGSRAGAGDTTINYQITNSANTALSGSEKTSFGDFSGNVLGIASFTIIGHDVPGVTSAVTYKLRFASEGAAITTTLRNNTQTGQLIAI
jgi:hypothetical protein